MTTITIVEVDINFNDTRELYECCGFSVAETICQFFYNSEYTHFTVNDIECELSLMTLFNDKDCCNGSFDIFITTKDESVIEQIQKDDNLKHIIFNQIHKIVDYLNENISIIIPINDFNNILYNEYNDCFYVKLGESTPDTIKLALSFNQDINDVSWY